MCLIAYYGNSNNLLEQAAKMNITTTNLLNEVIPSLNLLYLFIILYIFIYIKYYYIYLLHLQAPLWYSYLNQQSNSFFDL